MWVLAFERKKRKEFQAAAQYRLDWAKEKNTSGGDFPGVPLFLKGGSNQGRVAKLWSAGDQPRSLVRPQCCEKCICHFQPVSGHGSTTGDDQSTGRSHRVLGAQL